MPDWYRGQKTWGKGMGIVAARQIADKLGRIPHDVYVEPFLGRGDVWRAMPPAGKDILNDKDCRRIAETRKKTCGRARNPKCVRFTKEAKVSCGRDWKTFLKHDAPGTLFYLDPPWVDVDKRAMNYKFSKGIPSAEIMERTRGLKGAVGISYKNTPEERRVLCKKPFRCSFIRKQLFGKRFTQILAIKPGGSTTRASRELRGKSVPEEPWGLEPTKAELHINGFVER